MDYVNCEIFSAEFLKFAQKEVIACLDLYVSAGEAGARCAGVGVGGYPPTPPLGVVGRYSVPTISSLTMHCTHAVHASQPQ